MSKSFFKKILSIVLSLFIMVILIPKTKVEADSGNIIIHINGQGYNLNSSKLPDGLRWDAVNEVLIMDGYVGGDIQENTNNPIIDLTIQVKGENTITARTNQDALRFRTITIKGNKKEDDKLTIFAEGYNNRAILSGSGFEMSKVDLQINAKLWHSKTLQGIHTFYKMIEVKDAILSIDLSKSSVSNEEMHGIYGGLNLSEGASAKFTVRNTEASGGTSASYNSSPIINGAYYVEANYKAEQGSKDNPYVISKVKVRADKNKLVESDIAEVDGSIYNAAELFTISNQDEHVDAIDLSDSENGTTFYVKMYKKGNDSNSAWFKVTVFRDGAFYDLDVIEGEGSGSYKSGDEVRIFAGTAPEGHEFDKWTSDNENLIFKNADSSSTTITMLDEKVSVTANFKKEQSIKVNGTVYSLWKDTLPNGLEWDADAEVLIMDGYYGGYIQDSVSSVKNNLAIRVVGENTITVKNDEEALLFRQLLITGTDKEKDKLSIKAPNSKSRVIYSGMGMTIKDVTLEIETELFHEGGNLYAIHLNESKMDVENANLFIKATKLVDSSNKLYGVYNKLNLINGSKAEFILSNRFNSSDIVPDKSSFLYIKNAYYLDAYYVDGQGGQDNPFLIREVRVAQDKKEIRIDDIDLPAGATGVLYKEGELTKVLSKIELLESHPTTFYVKLKDSSNHETWHKFTVYRGEQLFNIAVENDGNGTASASLVNAKAGEEITLDVKANGGYIFKAWEVVSGDVTITENKFIMPSNNVVIKATFSKLPDQPTFTYKVLSGDKSIWEKGSSKGISIKIDGDIKKFESLEVDGKIVDGANYEVNAGSTVIILSPSYLEGLLAGNYEMTAKFEGAEVAATFSIKEKIEEEPEEEPKEEKPEVKPDDKPNEEKPKEEKPKEEKPGDKLPGMGDNTKPLALFLIALGGLIFIRNKTEE